MLPQANGRLLKISGGGFTEEPGADRDAGAAPAKYEGTAPIYYRERQDRRLGPAGRDVALRRTIIVETDELDAGAIAIDDVVDFEVNGQAQSGKLQAIQVSQLGAMAGSGVQTTRLELEPA